MRCFAPTDESQKSVWDSLISEISSEAARSVEDFEVKLVPRASLNSLPFMQYTNRKDLAVRLSYSTPEGRQIG